MSKRMAAYLFLIVAGTGIHFAVWLHLLNMLGQSSEVPLTVLEGTAFLVLSIPIPAIASLIASPSNPVYIALAIVNSLLWGFIGATLALWVENQLWQVRQRRTQAEHDVAG